MSAALENNFAVAINKKLDEWIDSCKLSGSDIALHYRVDLIDGLPNHCEHLDLFYVNPMELAIFQLQNFLRDQKWSQ